MKKVYQQPALLIATLQHEAIICTSTPQAGDIGNVQISTSETISSIDQFGVKGNAVQWDDWGD